MIREAEIFVNCCDLLYHRVLYLLFWIVHFEHTCPSIERLWASVGLSRSGFQVFCPLTTYFFCLTHNLFSLCLSLSLAVSSLSPPFFSRSLSFSMYLSLTFFLLILIPLSFSLSLFLFLSVSPSSPPTFANLCHYHNWQPSPGDSGWEVFSLDYVVRVRVSGFCWFELNDLL